MSDRSPKRYSGDTHRGGDNTAPYPVSRMAPAVELVDLAAEIAEADQMISNVTVGKLQVIAEQVRALQEQARAILDQAREDQALHRAQCGFKRTPGATYHVYRKPDGRLYFSMLSPQEWGGEPPHPYHGAYRLENDMSWTPADQAEAPTRDERELRRLLEVITAQREGSGSSTD